MALDKDGMKRIVDGVVAMVKMLDSGEATAQVLRDRARKLPNGQGNATLAWIDLAEVFHKLPRHEAPAPPVKNPRFRKGTAMQPAKWADCVWQPSK